MNRNAIQDLITWKASEDRKPMVLKGARQGRILMVFRSIVAQLAKPNEKFMYGVVREGGRAREFEEAVEWLVSAGMLNRVFNVSKMEHPLSAAILLKTDYQFKGPLTENYCLQQFRGQFEIGPATSLTKIMKLTLCCNMGLRLSPLK